MTPDELYRQINALAQTIGGVECDPSLEQAATDLRHIRRVLADTVAFRDIVRAAKNERDRAYAALNERIHCHDACVEKRDSGRCAARDALMRCCADRDARRAMGDVE